MYTYVHVDVDVYQNHDMNIFYKVLQCATIALSMFDVTTETAWKTNEIHAEDVIGCQYLIKTWCNKL